MITVNDFGGDNGLTLVFKCQGCGEWLHYEYSADNLVEGKYRQGLLSVALAAVNDEHECDEDEEA
jgi:hypothetical protein